MYAVLKGREVGQLWHTPCVVVSDHVVENAILGKCYLTPTNQQQLKDDRAY